MIEVSFPCLIYLILYEAILVAGSEVPHASKRIRIHKVLAFWGVKWDNRSIVRVQHRLVDGWSFQVWQIERFKDFFHVISRFVRHQLDGFFGLLAILRFCRCGSSCWLSWRLRTADLRCREIHGEIHVLLLWTLQNTFGLYWWRLWRRSDCLFLTTTSQMLSFRSLSSFHFVLVITARLSEWQYKGKLCKLSKCSN
jgi:hypothetical protein